MLNSVLIGLIAVGVAATDIYTPCFPELCRIFDVTPFWLELSVTMDVLGYACACPVWGPLADRNGVKRMLIYSSIIFFVSTCFAAMSQSVEMFLVARFVQGIGSSAATPLTLAVFRRLYGQIQFGRLMALLGISVSVSPAVAPILGSLLMDFGGWRLNFWFLAILIALFTYGIAKYVEEYKEPTHCSPIEAYKILLSNKIFVRYALVSGAIFGGLYSMIITAPHVYMTLLNVSAHMFSLMIAISVFTYMAGAFITRQLLMRVDADVLIKHGLRLCVIGGSAMVAFLAMDYITPWTLRISASIFTFGMGFVFGNCSMRALSSVDAHKGSAGSLYSLITFGVNVVLMAICSAVNNDGYAVHCIFILVTALLGLGIYRIKALRA